MARAIGSASSWLRTGREAMLLCTHARAKKKARRKEEERLGFSNVAAALRAAPPPSSPLGQKGFRGSKYATATTRAALPPAAPRAPFRETGRKGPSQRLVRDHRCWLQPQQAAGDAWCGILGMRRFSPIGWF